MTFQAQLLQPTSVQRTINGYSISLGLPWYRSLPWSCVQDIEVSIDSVIWPFSSLDVVIDGRVWRADELAKRWDSYWYVQDRVLVRLYGGPDISSADVRVSMALLLPNVLIENQAALVRTESYKRLEIQE
ncbi:DUF6379 domain-containing protein [Paenarthrobacter sp. TYUT067]|uniref:C-glycoside deglycosidase beta subunit domain-containing protein n=1 Tax=Paenarthrobacter sp. TYUT067 TaxID=2926245 RepID=UPI002030ECC6|nr:DUF6379 domain-containing protein [Paenarthrobacter sp. TYUT067]MCM0616825.1 DUF6379 domain-containing protein [Paenarthrobacter sp. TYUT067]